MADPVKRPLKWSNSYPAYAEKHDMYRVFQELLKELIIRKPSDPLAYIRDEITNIARLLYAPRTFIVGPNVVSQGIGRNMANKCGAKYLTLTDVVEAAPASIRGVLTSIVNEDTPEFDENLRKLLVAAIRQRLSKSDCMKNGYILFGFPQNQMQARCAQQNGLLPRQVYVLLPSQIPIKSKVQMNKGGDASSDQVAPPELDYANAKAIVEAYDFEICKTIAYEKWSSTKKQDIEAELLAHLVSMKPCGSPFVPKVLIIGPPFCGKSTIAEELAERFSFVNVDFMGLVRGATALKDETGIACKKYLSDLKPLNEDYVRTLLQRRMLREDCQSQGWVLHGFPDTANQLRALESLQLTPNRVFLMYCTEEACSTRLQQKRNEVLKQKLRLPGDEDKGFPSIDEVDFAKFPYGKTPFRMRYQSFIENLADITAFFGKQMVYVDATQKKETIITFVEEAVLRPPIIRYPDPADAGKNPH